MLMKLGHVPISVSETLDFSLLKCPILRPIAPLILFSPPAGVSLLPSDTRARGFPKLLERAGSKLEDCAQQ